MYFYFPDRPTINYEYIRQMRLVSILKVILYSFSEVIYFLIVSTCHNPFHILLTLFVTNKELKPVCKQPSIQIPDMRISWKQKLQADALYKIHTSTLSALHTIDFRGLAVFSEPIIRKVLCFGETRLDLDPNTLWQRNSWCDTYVTRVPFYEKEVTVVTIRRNTWLQDTKERF
jgi:hypothetical protein